ncbi:MAG: TlpA family protein disulfide reductase [Gammaproteobacteria bacterium]|nr:TlpA family protein disulfide reductase [Gammaproteobacteria bacterium]MDH5660297.1 TlpA family protein disulfide reductase [Gammaproteobacteria bacterium]
MKSNHLLKFNLSWPLLLITLLFVSFSPRLVTAEEIRSFILNSETEIEYTAYEAEGDTLFLWLYSEAGPQKSEHDIASQLAKKNIEVWRIDLFAAHFLPVASSSMDRIPDTDISELIEYAFKQTGKKIIPITTGRGSLPVLKGASRWQTQYKNSPALAGVILMSPKFFIETPEPGVKGKLLGIVEQTNLPLFILQPQKSPWYWKLDQTIPALEKNGSDVFVQTIKGVRDRYYFRPDADDYEKSISTKLPATLKRAAKYLNTLPHKSRHVERVSGEETKTIKVKTGKKERKLSIYKGVPTPPELILYDLNNKQVDLKQLKGNVVLVNFWASWCPPCVHEMPSMERLKKRFSAKGFTILGVNMAEDRKTVEQFLSSKVSISFPVLFDSQGNALKRWGVFAFPTSYVIDKAGNIRYALFGGIDWETEDIIKKISRLIDE